MEVERKNENAPPGVPSGALVGRLRVSLAVDARRTVGLLLRRPGHLFLQVVLQRLALLGRLEVDLEVDDLGA